MLIHCLDHGYIPRNGITTVAQTVIAAARVFNMGAYVQLWPLFKPRIINFPTQRSDDIPCWWFSAVRW